MCTFLLENGALWDICIMHCGICEMRLPTTSWRGKIYPITHTHVFLCLFQTTVFFCFRSDLHDFFILFSISAMEFSNSCFCTTGIEIALKEISKINQYLIKKKQESPSQIDRSWKVLSWVSCVMSDRSVHIRGGGVVWNVVLHSTMLWHYPIIFIMDAYCM